MNSEPTFPADRPLWVIHIGHNDRIALRARDEGFVCIGWTSLGDLTRLNTREELRSALKSAYPSASPNSISSQYGQPFRFAHEMEAGDALVFPVKPTSEIVIGRIAGPYRWADDDGDLVENDLCNVRPVEWVKIVPRTVFSQSALHSFGSFLTVSTSDDHLEEVEAVLSGAVGTGAPVDSEPVNASETLLGIN